MTAHVRKCLFDGRTRCTRLRRWRPSWWRRRRSATKRWRLCGRSVNPVWRTPALSTTPEHAAVDQDWWAARSDPHLHAHSYYCIFIICMGPILAGWLLKYLQCEKDQHRSVPSCLPLLQSPREEINRLSVCSWRTCWTERLPSPSGSTGRRSTPWSRKDSGRAKNSAPWRRNTQRWPTAWTAYFQTVWRCRETITSNSNRHDRLTYSRTEEQFTLK